jgi:hemerythrin-like domain-containing protein
MAPTQTLRHEHEAVCLVVNAADRKAAATLESGQVDGRWVREFVEFSRGFTDRCHHLKEERHLFQHLHARSPDETQALIDSMLAEHEGGRERVRRLLEHLEAAEAGDETATALVAEQLSAYSQLLRSHIAKENNVLFPLADRVLTEDDRSALDEAFEQVEREEMGSGEHERLHALAERLTEGLVDPIC